MSTPTPTPEQERRQTSPIPPSPTPPDTRTPSNSTGGCGIGVLPEACTASGSGRRSKDPGRGGGGVGYFELEQRLGGDEKGVGPGGLGSGITLKVFGDVWRWLGDGKVCSLREEVVEANFSHVHVRSVIKKAGAIAKVRVCVLWVCACKGGYPYGLPWNRAQEIWLKNEGNSVKGLSVGNGGCWNFHYMCVRFAAGRLNEAYERGASGWMAAKYIH